MSKYVKNLVAEHVHSSLEGVDNALLVNVVGVGVNVGNRLRTELLDKGIHLLVVKNSVAVRALAETPLSGMFDGLTGSAAICWGSEDIVSLAKEVTRLAEDDDYSPFEARGGMMDGEQLSPEAVKEISKWPTRGEQLSLLVGQILGPGAKLAAQLTGPGSSLASQIASKAEEGEEASGA